jgi:hypothetical protein
MPDGCRPCDAPSATVRLFSLSPSCCLPMRRRPANLRLRSPTRSCVALVVLSGVLAGQIGLPNRTPVLGAAAHRQTDPPAGCCCGWWARAWGRCCCQTKAAPSMRSCCAQRNRPPAAQRACCAQLSKEQRAFVSASTDTLRSVPADRPGWRGDCPCDGGSTPAWLRCHDPRMIAELPQLKQRVPLVSRVFVGSESCRSERSRPAVPPPRTPLAQSVWG